MTPTTLSKEVWVTYYTTDEFMYHYTAHETQEEADSFAESMEKIMGGEWGVTCLTPKVMDVPEMDEGEELWIVDGGEAFPMANSIYENGFDQEFDYLADIQRGMERKEVVSGTSESDALARVATDE